MVRRLFCCFVCRCDVIALANSHILIAIYLFIFFTYLYVIDIYKDHCIASIYSRIIVVFLDQIIYYYYRYYYRQSSIASIATLIALYTVANDTLVSSIGDTFQTSLHHWHFITLPLTSLSQTSLLLPLSILLLFYYYRREYLFICVYLVSVRDTSFYRYLFVLITYIYIYINIYDDDLPVTLTILSTIIVVINEIHVVIVIIIAITFPSHRGRRNWITIIY